MTDLKNDYNPDIEQVKKLGIQDKDLPGKSTENENWKDAARKKIAKCGDILANYFECMQIYNDEKLEQIRRKIEQQHLNEQNRSKMSQSQLSLNEQRQSTLDHRVHSKVSNLKTIDQQVEDKEELPIYNYLQIQPRKLIKRYSEIYDKSYSERKAKFGYTFEQVERQRQLQYIKKSKTWWEEFKRLICCRGGNYLQQLQQIQTQAESEINQNKFNRKGKGKQGSFSSKKESQDNIFLYDEENFEKDIPQTIIFKKPTRKANKNIKVVTDTIDTRMSQDFQTPNPTQNKIYRQNYRQPTNNQLNVKPKPLSQKLQKQYQYHQKQSSINNHISDETAQQQKAIDKQAKSNIKTQETNSMDSQRTNNNNTNNSHNYNYNYTSNQNNTTVQNYYTTATSIDNNLIEQTIFTANNTHHEEKYNNAITSHHMGAISSPNLNGIHDIANNLQYQSMENSQSGLTGYRNINNQYTSMGNTSNTHYGMNKSEAVFFNDEIKDEQNNEQQIPQRTRGRNKRGRNKNSFENDSFQDQVILDSNNNNYSNPQYEIDHNESASQIGNSNQKIYAGSNLVSRDREQQNKGYTLDDIPHIEIEQSKIGAETSTFKKKRKNKKNLKQQFQLNQQINDDEIIYEENFLNINQSDEISHIHTKDSEPIMEIQEMKAPQSMFKKKKNKRKNLVIQQQDEMSQEVYTLDEI